MRVGKIAHALGEMVSLTGLAVNLNADPRTWLEYPQMCDSKGMRSGFSDKVPALSGGEQHFHR